MPEEAVEYEVEEFLPEPNDTTLYIIDRWQFVQDDLVVEGHITAITFRWELVRSGLGGDAYNKDAVSGYARLEPNLKCDIRVPKAKALIESEGDDIAVVGEVYKRFGRIMDLHTHDLMVQHVETLYTERPKSKVQIREKEVQPTTETVEL